MREVTIAGSKVLLVLRVVALWLAARSLVRLSSKGKQTELKTEMGKNGERFLTFLRHLIIFIRSLVED